MIIRDSLLLNNAEISNRQPSDINNVARPSRFWLGRRRANPVIPGVFVNPTRQAAVDNPTAEIRRSELRSEYFLRRNFKSELSFGPGEWKSKSRSSELKRDTSVSTSFATRARNRIGGFFPL